MMQADGTSAKKITQKAKRSGELRGIHCCGTRWGKEGLHTRWRCCIHVHGHSELESVCSMPRLPLLSSIGGSATGSLF